MAGYPGRLGRGAGGSRRLRLAAAVVVAVLAAALSGGCELFEAEPGPYSVQGSVYSFGAVARAELSIRRGASVIDDAGVDVNGVPVPFDLQAYRADLGPIPPATPVTIDIEFDVHLTETIVMPDIPVVSGPAAQSYTTPIPVSWTIGTPPEYFVVFVDKTHTISGNVWAVVLSRFAAGYTIPANTFSPSPSSSVNVFAVNETKDLGSDFTEDSTLNVTNIGIRTIDTN